MHIQKKGVKTLYVKTAKISSSNSIGPKELSAACYRDGKGNVSLAMSSEAGHRELCWDCVLINECDRRNGNETDEDELVRRKACFHLVEICEENTKRKGHTATKYNLVESDWALIEQKNIVPVTSRQGTPEWFVARKFSLTSSTAYALVSKKLNISERLPQNFSQQQFIIKAFLEIDRITDLMPNMSIIGSENGNIENCNTANESAMNEESPTINEEQVSGEAEIEDEEEPVFDKDCT